jgi:5'-3' exonuclease
VGLSIPSSQPDIVAFDVANIAFRAAFRFKKYSTPQGRFSGHIFGTFRIINGMKKRFERQGKRVTLWFALEGGALQRTKLLPEYKANRRGANSKPPQILKDVYQLVKAFPGVTWRHPKLEADDVLSRVTHPSVLQGRKIVIVSKDHDLWQLLYDPAVSIYYDKEVLTHIHVTAKYGLRNPKAFALYKALFGDTSDNIPAAAPNLIKTGIVDLINEKKIKDPSDLYEAIHQPTKLTAKTCEKLFANWENLERNWKIVRLRRKGKIKPQRLQGPDNPGQLLSLLKTFACNSLLRDAEQLWR